MTVTTKPLDLIPLAAAAVALGYQPDSAPILAFRGTFPVQVVKQGRYRMVDRAEVQAELKRRPHLTKAQYKAILKAHETPQEVPVSPAASVKELLSSREWLTTAEVARALSVTPAVVKARHDAGALPFSLEPDPASKHGGLRAAALDVAAYLAAQEPSWPTAEQFAAVPSLSLAEVKHALGDKTPAGAGDPATRAFLASRETITPADFALMLSVPTDTLKRRIQRGQVETVEAPSATGTQRKLKRIRSDYAAAELSKSPAAG